MKTAIIDKRNRKEARPGGDGAGMQYAELLKREKYWVTFRKQEAAHLRAMLADVIHAHSEPNPSTIKTPCTT